MPRVPDPVGVVWNSRGSSPGAPGRDPRYPSRRSPDPERVVCLQAVWRPKRYNATVSQTLTKLTVHVVFSAKNRRDLIAPRIASELYAYIGGICRTNDSPLLAIGGTANHVHLLISLSKNIALADLMMTIKKDSSRWIKTKGGEFDDFYWQDGYGAFSVSESQVSAVLDYIARQEERHRTQTFEEELVAFAEKHGIAYDPRYLFT